MQSILNFLLIIFISGAALAQNGSEAINNPSQSLNNPSISSGGAKCDKPDYPTVSRRFEEEGTVRLKLLVSISGIVLDSEILSSSGYTRLDEAARIGVSKCIFKPAVINGIAEERWATLNYTWRLEPSPDKVNNQPSMMRLKQLLGRQYNISKIKTCRGVVSSQWNNCLGSINLSKGESYVGIFAKGIRDGLGAFYSPVRNIIYLGDFKNNNLSGFGVEISNNGDVYSGLFDKNERNGEGIEYLSTGLINKQGNWENGILTKSILLNIQSFPFPNQDLAIISNSNLPEKIGVERLPLNSDELRKVKITLEKIPPTSNLNFTQNNNPLINTLPGRRVALVIGNATYKVNPLKNPVNDSNDMARSLRSVGFDVIEVNNATLVQMREATRRFADNLLNSDVGLVYYSGHGVEVRGKNYLIPVNADIKREYEVVDQAFDASQFLEMMDNIRGPNNKRVNILIVDACRNNELQRSWRSTTNGLARMDAPGGTFISFATAPGRVASDGVGRNSPYTKHLLQALKQPNMPIEQVFKVVRRNVMDETKGEQIPWENSSLVGDFFFTVRQ
jgi:TonB family protein